MRLFVAVQPPQRVIQALDAVVTALRPEHPRLRWTLPEQWHVTLTFLGEVPDGAVGELEHRLARVVVRQAPFPVELGGGGRFGHRVLFASVRTADRRLHRLAQGTSAAARRAGIAVEDRPAHPHLTLARAREDVDLRPVVAALDPLRGLAWTVDAVRLMRSTLGRGPGLTAIHAALLDLPLTGSAQPASSSDRARRPRVVDRTGCDHDDTDQPGRTR